MSARASRTWGLAGLALAGIAIPFGVVLLAIGGDVYVGVASVLAGVSVGLKGVSHFYLRRRH